MAVSVYPSQKSSWIRPSLDWLLVFVPVAFVLRYVPAWQYQTALFLFSAFAIIPIAGWMGHATEQIAHRMGEAISGLLNASFGNAAELIIALMALRAGHLEVVKASIYKKETFFKLQSERKNK